MTEAIKNSLRESKAARWSALAVVAFTMLCGYYLTDVIAPLKGLLEGHLGWGSSDFGFFNSAYGWFNVFLGMLIIGGIILDKMGVRFTGLMAAIVMVSGTAVKYWAVSTHSLDGITWNFLTFTAPAQVFIAGLGFAIFAVGVEVAGITVSKIIYKWFKGKELALAMGLEMATARLGTALALATSVPIAKAMGITDVSRPILLGLILLCIGLLSFVMYMFMDKKLDASEVQKTEAEKHEDAFRLSDILMIIKNKGFWYIAILCVLFYSAVFPFLKYAADLMVNKFHISEELAGTIPSMLPFGTILLTPLFGSLYDRKGKGASIMMLGSLLIISVHALFSVPFLNQGVVAIILILILGVGFSLVPSAMWPSVPKIIPEKQLGTAYALIFWVQNWGLMGVPALIGWILEKYCITGQVVRDGITVNSYNYTLPMMVFTGFGVLALFFAFLLKAEDRKKGYGLELPNIKK
ncbi:MAG TPA: oxalate:formate antiporter [Marinilabiliales bacterium]|jgi:nitrate/nitrite transporter NarK|nr:MFS transporter [Salinivirgaceae bacterium]OFX48711.1 MAG: oxalate:formate antiporter [Bacteroidetes bacterium GWA2_40_14]OFX57131.1 MAG: oxalate:formate antiporter [Bacteroidetes bacterium GWC2_40_13]OFX73175.1 MAG: oxalate:formate antiporter [Bacteroidetes bacterium GWD2_40_43]OFX91730.1 MAG: oxalate:formate antiporter [Bacteroidetes bacterium GWE2_40_63]OFY24540.1 MAG: oxalate:formate antiporter [Bacteroidetes bacterium GWF2_40_13]OFZ23822.1 MAG: oxalate:formate antiporter [Bacteroidete